MLNPNDLDSEEFAPDIVNSLKNPLLLSAIRALLYSNDSRNREAFTRTLLDSTLIVLTNEPPKTPNNAILNYDEEGFILYDKTTQVSLIQLSSHLGTLILPVFTESKFIHRMKGLNQFHGLAISACDLLEISLTAQSSSLCINPGSQEYIMLDRSLIEGLVAELKECSRLPSEDLMKFHGHNF